MAIILLLLIYLIFISLGLPDSILGSSFPAIAENLSISVDQAGYISMVICVCTIISATFSDKLISKIGTKWTVSISIILTVIGLIIFSFTTNSTIWMFYLAALPLGLGAGCIDSALNNYVALHYKAIHMNWLHCCWGIGASTSPLIIGQFIDSANHSSGWNRGVQVVALIQLGICVLSFISIPLWEKVEKNFEKTLEKTEEKLVKTPTPKSLFRNPVFYLAISGFFLYCSFELTCGFWSGNYFYYAWNVDTSKAATLTSLFYIGIAVGRFVCGIISLKVKEKGMIRLGSALLLVGTICMMMPFSIYFGIVGMLLCGLGCSPIYPAIIKMTPYRFSKSLSQKVMGLQMALAYCGNLIVSPLYGFICKQFNNAFFTLPYLVFTLASLMIVVHEVSNAILKKRDLSLTEEEKKEYSTI